MAVKSQNGTVAMPIELDIESLEGKDIYTTSRGIKLRIVPVPVDIISQAQERIPAPKPPIRPDPENAGQYFEVHSDPKYLRDLEEYNRIKGQLNFQIAAAYGVQAYHVPEGMYGPDDEGWEKLATDEEVFSIDGVAYLPPIPDKSKPRARFTTWLRFYAIGNDDISPLYDAFAHGLGHILEKDVEEAQESFPGGN